MTLRKSQIEKLRNQSFDVLIIGGGINGAVSAAALSAKGATVAVIDRGDFAGETSSQSSNLVWGGIKYLESHEYRLVSKLCKSRNHLTESFPSTVKEIRFLTTIQKGFRFPVFLVFLGTLLYWVMGRFFTQAPQFLSANKIKKMEPIIDTSNAQGGFEYSDCYLFDNDARFVFNFIRASMNNGAIAANYVEAKDLKRNDNTWLAMLEDKTTGDSFSIQASAVINACGPYVDALNKANHIATEHRHVLSKGIHLIVDKITSANKVLAFFAADGRLFFVIPMGPKTCIGTTDTKVLDADARVSVEDRRFILDNVNHMLDLHTPLTDADIIAQRCGVRPLAVVGQDTSNDWVQLSRKHAIDVDNKNTFLSIFGGKLTDCINVGNEVADIIESFGIALDREKKWYGESSSATKMEFKKQAEDISLDKMSRADIHEKLSDRLWRRYDIEAFAMLEAIRSDIHQADIVIPGTEYRRCELEYIARAEMVTTLDDFLRRRSKIALVLRSKDLRQRKTLEDACEILFGSQANEKLEEYLKNP